MTSILRPFVAAVGILALGVPLVLAGCAPVDSTAPVRHLVAPAAPLGAEGPLGLEDGYVPVGETVSLGDTVPAIQHLDPVLRDALERAAAAALERNVVLTFTDAWRSARYQQFLYDQAVLEYGEEEAGKWVMTPDRSSHVTGNAVDIATADAMDWLVRFGAEFGLCQLYANESWHYELVPGAAATGCPEQLRDSSALAGSQSIRRP